MNGEINNYTPGTFSWAMENAKAGRDARRYWWPIEIERAGKIMPGGCGSTYTLDRDFTRIWHIYSHEGMGVSCGWNSGVDGADGGRFVGLGQDSGGYDANAADRGATDWQLVRDVTKSQCEGFDQIRRWKWVEPDSDEPESKSSLTPLVVTWLAIASAVGLFVLWRALHA